MSAGLGEAIGGLIVGGIDALQKMRESTIAAEREEAERQLARARAAIEALPVRTGPGGTWDADTESRMRGGTAPTEPPTPVVPRLTVDYHAPVITTPPSPFDDPEDA